MTHRKVVYPSPQYWVDELHYSAYWLGAEAPENNLELAQQLCSLLQLWGVLQSPRPFKTANATKLKAQKPKALSLRQVHDSALLFIDLNLELGQLLSQSLIYRPKQPVMTSVTVHQDHKVSSPGESHPQALSEPGVSLSTHRAPIIQPMAKSPSASERRAAVRDERSDPANTPLGVYGD